MLTPQQIYKKLNVKVNKNDTNTGVKIPKSIFVILFNEQKRKYLDQELASNESNDEIDSFSEILSQPTLLTKVAETTTRDDFKLPLDFLKRATSYSVASKGSCKENILVNWFVKPKNINVLLQNDKYRPSFEYQETLALINSGNISVYKDDFTLDKVYLTYYKDPADLDIEGYIREDGTASKDVPIALGDLNIDKIIDRTVVEISNNYQNLEQLQTSLQRQQLNEQRK